MIDYYLSVPSEADMPEIPEVVDVSIIGHWFERVGGTDAEPIMQQVPGWHFNVRAREPIEWPTHVTQSTPTTPWQVWA